eukprot:328338-Prymnesium_polylepis.1
MTCLKPSAFHALPGSKTLGNSWHSCRCTPRRCASQTLTASASGLCIHVRALRYRSTWSQWFMSSTSSSSWPVGATPSRGALKELQDSVELTESADDGV